MVPVRWGLLPVSGIAGRAMMPAFAQSRCASVGAVGSRDRSKALSFATAHAIPRAYGSYDELMADNEIEAVYLSLPNGQHIEWAIRALDAGKHVLCEKPMDGDPQRVRAAFDRAQQAGLLLMEAFMYRHHPDTAKLFAAAASELGAIHHVRAALSFTMPGSNNIRLQAQLLGGALMDVGCYAISALRVLAGEPEAVSGLAEFGPTGVDMRFSGWMRGRGGAIGYFDCGLDLPSRSFLEVVGTSGILRADWPFFRPFFPHVDPPMIEVRVGLDNRRLPLVDIDPYLLQIDNFSRAIRGLEPPLLGREDALAQAVVIDALRRSSQEGSRWVDTRLRSRL